MRTISIMNVKGGVGKSTTAINLAYILAKVYGRRVLVVDLDTQSNTTKFFNRYDEDKPYVGTLLVRRDADVRDVITRTDFDNIDIIPANLHLLTVDKQVLLDTVTPQQYRLKRHLAVVSADYDYCIFDCPPSLSMTNINGLAMTDDVIVPLLVDDFSFTGLNYIIETIDEISEFNSSIQLAGCFVNMYKNSIVMKEGVDILRKMLGSRFFSTHIRDTVAVKESTFAKQPIIEYKPKSTAAQDYSALVKEYLKKVG